MSDESDIVHADAWQLLRRLTPARIALGRAGASLPTRAHLEFQLAHAQARDAVHLQLDTVMLADDIAATPYGHTCLHLHSAAIDRHHYLQRPDLGRQLDEPSAETVRGHAAIHGSYDLALVIADGLSAVAIQHHARPMVECISALARHNSWSIAPIALVEQGRVAIGDEIGELLGARATIVLIGERPGLSSPDSLGLYLTWSPRVGRNDAERNCISNIRSEGLSYEAATHKLAYLLREAFRRQLSGVQLKDEAEAMPKLESSGSGNFLLPDP